MKNSMKTIDHQYSFVSYIGRGMSGQVILVRDKDGLKALKFLNPLQLNVSREEALQNFKNEFAILKKLGHPHIAGILDFGHDETSRRYYFTSEYIEGRNFYDACAGQKLDVIERIFVQVLRAFHYLHSRGIYHLDVKPQNILVQMHGGEPVHAKIIDFGLAGFDTRRRMAGTPAYMAPEVIRGGIQDNRTDLYSLGVTFYKVLTGTNPFVSRDVREILARQINDKPPLASSFNAEVLPYWDHILERLLEKNPADRYQQASFVIRDLAFLSDKKIEAETEDTKICYLPERGALIGRDGQWSEFVRIFDGIFHQGENSETRLLVIQGEKGTGKTRFLAEIRHDSQLKGIPVMSWHDWQNHAEIRSGREKFVLCVPEEVTFNEVLSLLQELSQRQVLVIWLSESLPRFMSDLNVITLGNYTQGELRQYLKLVTGLREIPESWTDEIYSRTRGNPFFVTEVVKAMLAQDVIADYSSRWDGTAGEDIKVDFGQIHIPQSLEEILKGQYHALSKREQLVLEILALHQKSMPGENLKKVVGDEGGQTADGLLEKGILHAHGDGRIYFCNVLFADTIRADMDPAQATVLHDRLAVLFAGIPEENRSRLFHEGHGTDKDLAREALRELARQFMAESDHAACIVCLKKLLGLMEEGWDGGRAENVLSLAEACNLSRHYLEAIALVESVLPKIAEVPLSLRHDFQFALYQQIIDCAIKQSHMGDVDTYRQMAEEYCRMAREFVQETALPLRAELIIKNYLAYLKMIQGDLDDAADDFLDAHEAWRDHLDLPDKLGVVNNRLVDVLLLKQNYRDAIRICEERLQVFEPSNQHSSLASTHYVLGGVYYKLATTGEGDREEFIDKCVLHFKRSEEIAERIHNDNMLLCTLNGQGNAHLLRQSADLALDCYYRALKIARKISELETAGLVAFNISNIYKERRQTRDSYSFLGYVVNTFRSLPRLSPNSHFILFWSHLSLCDHFIQKSDSARAEDHLNLAQKLFQAHDYLETQKYWLVMREALYAHIRGDDEQWQTQLTKARQLAGTREQKDDLEQCLASEMVRHHMEGVRADAMSTVVPAKARGIDDAFVARDFDRQITRCRGEKEILKLLSASMGVLCGAFKSACLVCRHDGGFTVHPLSGFSRADEAFLDLELTRRSLRDKSIRYSRRDVLGESVQVLSVPLASEESQYGSLYFICEGDADLTLDLLTNMARVAFQALLKNGSPMVQII